MNYEYSMMVGGNVYHARPLTDGVADRRALCGRQPQSRRPMPAKGHWYQSYGKGDPMQGRPPAGAICPTCRRKLISRGVIES